MLNLVRFIHNSYWSYPQENVWNQQKFKSWGTVSLQIFLRMGPKWKYLLWLSHLYTICENISNSIAVIHTCTLYLFFIDKSPFNSTYIQCYNQLHNMYSIDIFVACIAFFLVSNLISGLVSLNWIIFLTIHCYQNGQPEGIILDVI